ncbi:hypothetical protein B5F55_09380 [Anaerotruncus colihominis]|uniref:Uncharacterized protein n=1 Tax=Anaerotruncus colihominis TaxID=169435 RepID=A0A3E3IM82_9FIRM|nr:hypothetical protein B5F55_09380 [Anaerotruncus colihominis]RGE68154.1 hypothetical protein DXC40_07335 [Anaerotruncus colihominis]
MYAAFQSHVLRPERPKTPTEIFKKRACPFLEQRYRCSVFGFFAMGPAPIAPAAPLKLLCACVFSDITV